jgi:hypothetical protein
MKIYKCIQIEQISLTTLHSLGNTTRGGSMDFFFMINKQAFQITVIKSWGGPIVNPLVAHASL